jgi:serine/threonine protein kinase
MIFINGNITISPDVYDNFIYLDGSGEFELRLLDPTKPYNKGASSSIFIIVDPSQETEDRVIKICKTPLSNTDTKSKDKIKRFKREIRAFQLVKAKKITGVIDFYGNGEIEILGVNYLYIILEKADCDLAEYLKKNKFNFTLSQRVNFCSNIVTNFENLHKIGIYHRDVKHDNIFCVADEFKIGDLGLITFKDRDYSMDYKDEKIGPFGWLSPEATNKMLSMNNNIYTFDCTIDDKSDVFQLGKLFWYILNGNLPLGQIEFTDSKFGDKDIFDIIKVMLQHAKSRRPTVSNVNNSLIPVKKRLII